MKRASLVFLLLVATLTTTAAPPSTGFPWGAFTPRKLAFVVQLDEKSAEKLAAGSRSLIFTDDFVRSKSTATYTGTTRPLSADRRAILDRWAQLKNYDPAYPRLYDEEFLFLHGNRRYWLAVQKPVAENLKRQAKADQSVDLYLISGVGAERISLEWDWLLLLQEYQIPN